MEVHDKAWVPSKKDVWRLGDVVSVSKDKKSITVEIGEEEHDIRQVTFDVDQTLSYDKQHDMEWNNVFHMGDLNEAAMLSLLKRRAQTDRIYTNVGDILISVNPYGPIKNLYEPIPTEAELKERAGEHPHIYQLADQAYNDMLNSGLKGMSQSILINGESGAGKTEAAKRIMSFLTDRSQLKRKEHSKKQRGAFGGMMGAGMRGSMRIPGLFGKRRNTAHARAESSDSTDDAPKRDVSLMERSVLETNPVLESFGNAMTIRNDNSSRFGKFLQLEYTKDGIIGGAKVLHFLLEKSRVVLHARGERSYHIFYQLCSAASKQAGDTLFDGLNIRSAEEYRYLNSSARATTADAGVPLRRNGSKRKSNSNRSASAVAENAIANQRANAKGQLEKDFQDFIRLNEAFDVLGVDFEEKRDIYRTLSAILHLGNLSFVKNKDESCGIDLSGEEEANNFRLVSQLLGVDPDSLTEALCQRTVRAGRRNSVTYVPLTIQEAIQSRDGLAKAMYEALFNWLVNRVNVATSQASASVMKSFRNSGQRAKNPFFIGILDIFGFEILEHNSFEQLCINYANEVLQGMFDEHVFQLELDGLSEEGISCPTLAFRDNKPLLELMDSKPNGVFQLLDEQGTLGPRGSDDLFLKAMIAVNQGKNERFGNKTIHDKAFEIIHFAGPVTYEVHGLVFKNSDHLQPDLAELIVIGNTGGGKGDGDHHLHERGVRKNLAHRMSKQSVRSSTGSRVSAKSADSSHQSTKGRKQLEQLAAARNETQAIAMGKSFPFLQIILERHQSEGQGEDFGLGAKKKKGKVHRRKSKHAAAEEQDATDDDENAARNTRKMAKLESVSLRFRRQMTELKSVLDSTMLHFVRCIKPNEMKKSPREVWDARMVSTQLKMLGILEMIRVRREGFPVRSPFEAVLEKYPELLRAEKLEWVRGENDRQTLAALLNAQFGSKSKGRDWQLGDTKCFMLESTLKVLDHNVRVKREASATALQLLARRQRARALLKKQKDAASKIAAHYRGAKERRKFQDYRSAVAKIQAIARKTVAQSELAQKRKAQVLIAKQFRGYVVRKKYVGIKGVVKLQSMARGAYIRARWEPILALRLKYRLLLRPNELIVHASKVVENRGRFKTNGAQSILAYTSGPSPRILVINEDGKLRQEIPWRGHFTSAKAVGTNKLVIYSDPPEHLDPKLKRRDDKFNPKLIQQSLKRTKKILTRRRKDIQSGAPVQYADQLPTWKFTILSKNDNAYNWLLMLQNPYTATDLLKLTTPKKFEPLTRHEVAEWVFGGPSVLGGLDNVFLSGTLEWTQTIGWKRRYFVLKGTSLYWFTDIDCASLPLGGLNLNEQCSVSIAKRKNTSKRRIHCLDVESPLLNVPMRLSFDTERTKKQWYHALKKAMKRPSDTFKRHTISRGYLNSQPWQPVEEALDERKPEPAVIIEEKETEEDDDDVSEQISEYYDPDKVTREDFELI